MAPHDVDLLLELVRQAHRKKCLHYRRDRDKNLSTLATLGITVRDMFAIVAALKSKDALRSPWKNTNPGFPDETTCEFGTLAEGSEVYVKVSVAGLDDGPQGCVISFHFPEKRLTYPFK